MRIKKYYDLRLADPFLKPNWRQQRVLRMLQAVPPERCKRYDDEWIKGYKKYLHLWRASESNRTDLMQEYPGIYFAHLIYEGQVRDHDMNLIIEARLLSGASYEEIADTCKTIPETIEWYEKLFFNVQSFLTHHDWILREVLIPAADRFALVPDSEPESDDNHYELGNNTSLVSKTVRVAPVPIANPHFDMSLKFFSYYGGPLVCDLMLSGFRPDRRVNSYDEIPDFFNEQFAVQIKRRSAQVAGLFEINKYNVMELFVVHSKLIELQRTADKDPAQKHSEFEKHVMGMLSSIPWATGKTGEAMYDGTAIGKSDNEAAEMSDEELLLTSAGLPVDLSGNSALCVETRKPITKRESGKKKPKGEK